MGEHAVITDASQRHARSIVNTTPVTKPVFARCFDLEAGIELAHGHHAAAKRLAWVKQVTVLGVHPLPLRKEQIQ
jgi:hypothetical protein